MWPSSCTSALPALFLYNICLSVYKMLTLPASRKPSSWNHSLLGRGLPGMVPRHQSAGCQPTLHEPDLQAEIQVQLLISYWYAPLFICAIAGREVNKQLQNPQKSPLCLPQTGPSPCTRTSIPTVSSAWISWGSRAGHQCKTWRASP